MTHNWEWHKVLTHNLEWHKVLAQQFPIRNLSKWQRRLCVEIVDYSWWGLELTMKWENWELANIDYQRIFLYWKMQLQTTMAIIAFTSGPYMVMKIIGIPTVFDDSQLLADYHWHFHASRWSCPFMQLTIVWILKANAHTHTRTHTHMHTHACWRQFTV